MKISPKKSVLTTFLLLLLFIGISLFIGKYPIRIYELFHGNIYQWKIFTSLRLSRTLFATVGGFALGVSGYIFQTVFQNPLASPDMIGVSSGASVGAAIGILLFSSGIMVTAFSFLGAILSLLATLLISRLDEQNRISTVVLSGICVHALAQTVLMFLKHTADPNNELAAIEYWIMGGLGAIRWNQMMPNLVVMIPCLVLLLLLNRQIFLLSINETEALSLGVSVFYHRLLILGIATLSVACVISLSGLICFIGLIVPHVARMILHRDSNTTIVLSGLLGGLLLIISDILSRSIETSELPISIFTSLIGVPFLLYLVLRSKS